MIDPLPHARWIARSLEQSVLAPIDVDELPLLESVCASYRVEPGTRVASAGEVVTQVLIVREGEIELFGRAPGERRVLMTVVRTGGVIADIPVLLEGPMPFDAVAVQPSTLLTMDREAWVEVLRRSPGLSLRWMRSIARRLDADRRRLLTITTKPLRAQLATLLLEHAETGPDGQRIVRLTHSTLAQLLGARRPSVSRVMRELRAEGMVASAYGATVLCDEKGLVEAAGPDPFP